MFISTTKLQDKLPNKIVIEFNQNKLQDKLPNKIVIEFNQNTASKVVDMISLLMGKKYFSLCQSFSDLFSCQGRKHEEPKEHPPTKKRKAKNEKKKIHAKITEKH